MTFFFIFENFSENWNFRPPRTCWHYGSIHTCPHYSSKWVNFYILIVLKWKYDVFLHFRKVFKKWKKMEKIEFFPHHGPVDIFVSIHTCAHFPSKWVNLCILVVLKWKYDDFLQFRKLFKKSKKLQHIILAHHGPVDITKTCLYNIAPLKLHFYIVKLGFTGVYIIFLISAKNIDCGYSLERIPTIYVWSRNMKNISSLSQNFQFLEVKFSLYLNRRVFVIHFSPIAEPSTFLAQFRHLHIFHPNEWIFYILVVLK